jgi:four helix bundle protein
VALPIIGQIECCMKTRRFRELLVWQNAMSLAREIYAITNDFPRNEIFGLTGQLRRAAISIPSNIAEGHGRLSDKSFALFLGQARGSLFEVETQLELACSLGYFPADKLPAFLEQCEKITRMLNALLKTLRQESEHHAPSANRINRLENMPDS